MLLIGCLLNSVYCTTYDEAANQDSQTLTETIRIKNDCKQGEFVCNKTEHCIPQDQICNGKYDCKDRSDEWNCDDVRQKEFWNSYFNKRPDEDREQKIGKQCDIFPVPVTCTCSITSIYCVHKYLTVVPSLLPSDSIVTELDVSGNNFEILSVETFTDQRFSKLQRLIITHCNIQEIVTGSFRRTPNIKYLYLSNNEIRHLRKGTFKHLLNLQRLDISYNPLSRIDSGTFLTLNQLKSLYIQQCRLTKLHSGMFEGLTSLQTLRLDGNRVKVLESNVFYDLQRLTLLSITKNGIIHYTKDSFSGMPQLRRLFLSWNNLGTIINDSFGHVTRLHTLNLNGNKIKKIEIAAFLNLTNLKSLNLKKNPLGELKTQSFTNLRNLEYIYFPSFRYCVYAMDVRVCRPKGDGISSINHLLDNKLLRISVWLMATLSCIGNVFVLVSRFIIKEQNKVHGFYIKNLSVADLLMGIYLLIIACYDVKFRGKYIESEKSWRSSWQCNFCGFLSTLSSQVSVFILTTITADRYFSVIRPLTQRKRTVFCAAMCMTSQWTVALLLSVLPLTMNEYYGKDFYGSNGVCLALQIHDPYAKAWEYSTFMFVGVNMVAFTFILIAYINMFITITASNISLRSTQQKQDTLIAKRFAFIVGTDFVCWMPIIIVKILSMTGVSINADLYAWIAIFILPVNSALNPILYTITTKMFRQRIEHILIEVISKCGCKRPTRFHSHNRSQHSNPNSRDGTSMSLSTIFNHHSRKRKLTRQITTDNSVVTNATNASLLSRYSRSGGREIYQTCDVIADNDIKCNSSLDSEKRLSCTAV